MRNRFDAIGRRIEKVSDRPEEKRALIDPSSSNCSPIGMPQHSNDVNDKKAGKRREYRRPAGRGGGIPARRAPRSLKPSSPPPRQDRSEPAPTATQPHARVIKRPSTELNRSRRQAAFLKAFVTGGVVLRAAQTAGVSRRVVYRWLAGDPGFRAKYDLAIEDAADVLEAEARRRAEHGWDEPIFQGGVQVGAVRKYSDALMITLLKGLKLDTYADHVESNLAVKATAIVDPRMSTDAELAARLERAVAVLRAAGAVSTPITETSQDEEGSPGSDGAKRGGQ